MPIKGIFFDFGFVIGYPRPDVERSYFYLNWDGIDSILRDPKLDIFLKPGIGHTELEGFLREEIYEPFIKHEQTDLIDPQSNKLLLEKLGGFFPCPIDQAFVDQLLVHIDTMKHISIDPSAVNIIHGLKNKGFWLSIVSNMMLPGKLLRAKLEEANILNDFDHVLISSYVGHIKPHPEIIWQALMRSRLKPEDVLSVGDTFQQDILGAEQVGVKTAWLNIRDEPWDMAKGNPPEHEMRSLAQIEEIFLSTQNKETTQ